MRFRIHEKCLFGIHKGQNIFINNKQKKKKKMNVYELILAEILYVHNGDYNMNYDILFLKTFREDARHIRQKVYTECQKKNN